MLDSYIYAYNWAMISYLQSKENVDIIEKEKNGEFYYFAKGNKNLLDEVDKYLDLEKNLFQK